MKATITKALLAALFLCTTAEASQLKALRSRLNFYLGDSSNTMLPAYIKDSIINVSQMEYAESFPVYIDTTRQVITAGTRLYALPSAFAGRVVSVHKNDANFTMLKYVPTESTIVVSDGTLEYYSTQEKTLIIYPRPPTNDTVFIFYAAYPTYLSGDTIECRLRNGLEEPIVLLAASKCWAMKEFRMDMADWFFNKYATEAARLFRLEQELPQR